MRDEDDGSALLEVFDDSEQKIDFLLLQHRGRLVEENRHITFDSAIERQRFGDLDHLPSAKVRSAQRLPGCTSRWTLRNSSAAAAFMRDFEISPYRRNSSSRPRKMFSATVRLGKINCSWKTIAMPLSKASRGDAILTGAPSTKTPPESG